LTGDHVNRPESERHDGCPIAAYATFRSEAGASMAFPTPLKKLRPYRSGRRFLALQKKRQFWSLLRFLDHNRVGYRGALMSRSAGSQAFSENQDAGIMRIDPWR